jgi:guanylate kinase/DNA-directed RNA polymerase omega subunit
LFVVSGPSGAGKDTLVDGLRLRHQRLKYSVSATTRAPRPGEREGIEYFFVTREAFEAKLAEGGFIEHRSYNDNLYGTPRSFINEALLDGYDVIMKPEVNGAIAIKERFPEAVLIFIVPDRFSHGNQRRHRQPASHRPRRTPLRPPVRLPARQRRSPAPRRGRGSRSHRPRRTHAHLSLPRYPDQGNRRKLMSNSVFGDLDGLLSHVDSKFSLVNVVTKRAKQLNNGAPALTDLVNANKPVSTAFNEVREGRIPYKRTKEGIK